jgi:DNA-binding XRE family transcriptional regulator
MREARGWSQAHLAGRAGVSRQLLGAVEAGRHQPSVGAALGLARALGVSVEELFGPPSDAPHDVLGIPSPVGTPVRAAQVGDRVVTVPAVVDGAAGETWGAMDALWREDGLDWLPGGGRAEVVLAGCDPVLGTLAEVAGRSGAQVLTVHASTGRSLSALAAGNLHGALVHARRGDLPTPPVPVRRWRLASWRVGLGGPLGSGSPPTLDELAARRPAVVQRDAGAGAQQALVRALRRVGAAADLPGPVALGHLDAARRVAYGVGEAGVVMEAAARAYGLPFTPLEEHDVELWIAREWAGLPGAVAVVEALTSPALLTRAARIGGYDTASCGLEVAS